MMMATSAMNPEGLKHHFTLQVSPSISSVSPGWINTLDIIFLMISGMPVSLISSMPALWISIKPKKRNDW